MLPFNAYNGAIFNKIDFFFHFLLVAWLLHKIPIGIISNEKQHYWWNRTSGNRFVETHDKHWEKTLWIFRMALLCCVNADKIQRSSQTITKSWNFFFHFSFFLFFPFSPTLHIIWMGEKNSISHIYEQCSCTVCV